MCIRVRYYRWEAAGAPLRLEIGAREAADGRVTAVNRLGTKSSLGPDALESAVSNALVEYDSALAKSAAERIEHAFEIAKTLEELKGSTRVRLVPWCGEEACGHRIEEAMDGSLLGTPEETMPFKLPPPAACLACESAKPTQWAVVGRQL